MHLYLLSRARHPEWAFSARCEFFLALSLNFLIFMEILDEYKMQSLTPTFRFTTVAGPGTGLTCHCK